MATTQRLFHRATPALRHPSQTFGSHWMEMGGHGKKLKRLKEMISVSQTCRSEEGDRGGNDHPVFLGDVRPSGGG